MKDQFSNSYNDAECARKYAKLEFPGTYYLAFRDIPQLIGRYVKGLVALDFGCGAGRSTRFLRDLGFDACGIDISGSMLTEAVKADPVGKYILTTDGELGMIEDSSMDLVLSAFTFDNIPSEKNKLDLFREFLRILKPAGIFINLVSNPGIYLHEWASFTTKDFPENGLARTGAVVKIINTSAGHTRPVDDILFPWQDYRRLYDQAGFKVLEHHEPLASRSEPIEWINETRIAPWSVHVVGDGLYSARGSGCPENGGKIFVRF